MTSPDDLGVMTDDEPLNPATVLILLGVGITASVATIAAVVALAVWWL